jgi:hypothetical protein
MYPRSKCKRRKTDAAYRRGDIFKNHRRLMEAWAQFCATPSAKGAVVPMRATR